MEHRCAREEEHPRHGYGERSQLLKITALARITTECSEGDTMCLVDNKQRRICGSALHFCKRRFRDHFDRGICGQKELGCKLLPPLGNEVIWNYNKDQRLMRLINDVLTDQDAGLDCFSEAHFVGKQISLDRISKNPANNRDLVFKQFY